MDEPGARPRQDAAQGVPAARHWSGFLASGAIAFVVDGGVMEFAVRVLGWSPLLGRLAGIASAMVAAWLAHRTLTFALTSLPTISEFVRYVAAAATTAVINYVVFAALLFAWPTMPRLVALALASFVATIFAYASMRYAVFRRS